MEQVIEQGYEGYVARDEVSVCEGGATKGEGAIFEADRWSFAD